MTGLRAEAIALDCRTVKALMRARAIARFGSFFVPARSASVYWKSKPKESPEIPSHPISD
jgi:hypothetical protein